jgi:hypothetical protein
MTDLENVLEEARAILMEIEQHTVKGLPGDPSRFAQVDLTKSEAARALKILEHVQAEGSAAEAAQAAELAKKIVRLSQ